MLSRHVYFRRRYTRHARERRQSQSRRRQRRGVVGLSLSLSFLDSPLSSHFFPSLGSLLLLFHFFFGLRPLVRSSIAPLIPGLRGVHKNDGDVFLCAACGLAACDVRGSVIMDYLLLLCRLL